MLPTFGESFIDRTRIYNELTNEFESTVSNVTCRLSDNQNSDVVGERVNVDVSINITVLVKFLQYYQLKYYINNNLRNLNFRIDNLEKVRSISGLESQSKKVKMMRRNSL